MWATWLPSALTWVDVSTAGSRGIWPVTALIVQVSMGGVPGVRCLIVVSLVPSRVSPQVVGPRPLKLLVIRPVAKEAVNSKVSKKNSGGRGHHSLAGNVALAAEKASSRGRPPH